MSIHDIPSQRTAWLQHLSSLNGKVNDDLIAVAVSHIENNGIGDSPPAIREGLNGRYDLLGYIIGERFIQLDLKELLTICRLTREELGLFLIGATQSSIGYRRLYDPDAQPIAPA